MLLHFFLVLLVAWWLTGVIRSYALSRNILDIPNQRSSHSRPTPRGGGLAIVIAFTLAMVMLEFRNNAHLDIFFASLATLSVAAIGFCDDHGHVAARWRFLTHLIAASFVLYSIGGFPALLFPMPFDSLTERGSADLGWLGYPFGLIMLVWFLNLFNFMDGTDGIAASESIFVSGALGAYLYGLDQFSFDVSVSLAVASLGFLLWNWPKAKIFMGDVGSGFLGLMLGILILMAAKQQPTLLYCGLILFGIFIVDATYTLLYRFLSGQKWFEAHCSHAYQRAAKRFGHWRILLATWFINLFWLLPVSLLVFWYPDFALFGLIVAYLPLLYLASYFKAGRVE